MTACGPVDKLKDLDKVIRSWKEQSEAILPAVAVSQYQYHAAGNLAPRCSKIKS
jgi:hypothetical protein